ncbi:MAG: alpha-glucan family phosphorylase [Candidatus Infernicultor aquiphilus]|uniref:Alpha-glucan family phosphorylase n=1 Tax=Candidatus Infernicultor aquiphilus TaxID=1805029 RepID=A0A2M7K8S8_9BACT|nr:alpha-glucan family phosphorylase [bacterium]PIU25110.1 MAG: alpha-glucan family phosphorylase [Candidatus Atribacteria bacterium CG08_land_8_20_14_0_20_33_29]PIW11216.1 MAG: alpha-glucan family phosphorylase [Candidatus Atribacteria bacterium CG17_big_fil_post_rev_8_21_14_2_50_34_11]PIX34531.1 MAG: alpha-glucan family phosphorylase [Candidatus Atribacteria bacterium CG_4_8_14_3_um_filter_34_18]PIY31024.1 MAG: alpha-glucan family phosphorylase [Candidatus Atribacteria bacterium CG_4_10_14_3_
MEAKEGDVFQPLEIMKKDRKIAYFSMEICVDARIPTYSGGLGILAGDMLRSSADLAVPLLGVTLLYKKGYLHQKIGKEGIQQELPEEWNPQDHMQLLPNKVVIEIEGRKVGVQAWLFYIKGLDSYYIPVFFLDTDLPENNVYDRSLSDFLYGGDKRYRLAQEIVLGIGGVRMLKELGFNHISKYHMNEGHASLLTLELLNHYNHREEKWSNRTIEEVKKLCIFTTHTPVPAGMDQFSYELVEKVLGSPIPDTILKELGGEERLNMTALALNLSHYINGVAKKHGDVSQEMFPGYHIDSITNGVHSATWVCPHFYKLYDRYIPGWKNDSFSLRYALSIPDEEVWQTHQEAKKILMDSIFQETGLQLDPEVLTIGFARRATAYKRADLIFYDINRLLDISRKYGKIQLVFSGKAHPEDGSGKELIRKIVQVSQQLRGQIEVVYLENYNINLAKRMVSGVDLWLNTPKKPQEASGTSGMKAAHNGIPSLSILDGWWIEGCIEGFTGWSIGSAPDIESSDQEEAASLYDKLQNIVIPIYYQNRGKWIFIMRHCIAINASFFNTHRMVLQYVLNAYL